MKVMRVQDVEDHRSFKAPLPNVLAKPNPVGILMKIFPINRSDSKGYLPRNVYNNAQSIA